MDEQTGKLWRLRTMHLFAGAGGGILADILLGHCPVCAVEINPYCQQVLSTRQKDGILPWFPIYDDVRAFDGKPWRGIADVVSGGFPCQDISSAGKGAGITGERSGLWKEMGRVIREVRPRYVFVENSPVLTSRGLETVLGDLAEMGFNAEWGVLGADDVGAPHRRKRIWILAEGLDRSSEVLAYTEGGDTREPSEWQRWEDFGRRGNDCGRGTKTRRDTSNADGAWELQPQRFEREERRRVGDSSPEKRYTEYGSGERETDWWESEPDVGRMAYGVASRVDRLKAIGNGQVPAVAALAWRILSGQV